MDPYGWTIVVSEPIAREFFYKWFNSINDHLPGFGRTVEIVRKKSGRAACYRIKFRHIYTFKFHVGKIIGGYEINLVKEYKTTKQRVEIVCTDEKPIKIDYSVSKVILMINLKYNMFNRLVSCIAFSFSL